MAFECLHSSGSCLQHDSWAIAALLAAAEFARGNAFTALERPGEMVLVIESRLGSDDLQRTPLQQETLGYMYAHPGQCGHQTLSGFDPVTV